MPRLDAKKLRLSDDTEISIRFSWQAAYRFREATGIDIADTQMDPREKVKRINQNLGALIHSILESKEDRAKMAAEDIGERIGFEDMPRIVEEIFGMLNPGTEGQQNAPFVNGVPSVSDSISKPPMPSGALISG